ncbi:MAG: SRPBCC family protein [Ramlibacter sp.]
MTQPASTPTPSETDRIERSVVLNAPRARVWRALSDAQEFGAWFGVNLQGQTFVAGQSVRGRITIEGYEHVTFEVLCERVEPEQLLSFRWHPYAIDPQVDYSHEQRTLVTFTLKDAGSGKTLLTVVESGFDKVPPQRRLEAFRMNSGGWTAQMDNIKNHVERA